MTLPARALLATLAGLALAGPAAGWTLSGTAPRFATRCTTCCLPDSARPASVRAVIVYRFGQQAIAWRPGCERSVACWDSVRAQAAPVQFASVASSDGAAFVFTIGDTTGGRAYFAKARGWNGLESPCWGRIVGRPRP